MVVALTGLSGLTSNAADLKDTIEAEWLAQLEQPTADRPTPQADAAGGCDGIKDGTWGFHTDDTKSPWWQVDLGSSHAIERVLVWNRCGGVEARASHLQILVSNNGTDWQQVFANDGSVFGGVADGKPLEARLSGVAGRWVRVQLPGNAYLHLDEVEVFGPEVPATNLALGRPATQSSVSQWSRRHQQSVTAAERAELLAKHWTQRRQALADPLLNFDDILFTKRVPGSFNHMSDQYYGWWSRPGGGIFILRNFKSENPTTVCLTNSFKDPGSFLRPMLSWDAKKVLFAWCRHYPALAAERDKLNKQNVPEDAFYHLFEMNIDGSGVRQLTRGKYDDFDGRYLPDGRIVFMSTRRGTR